MASFFSILMQFTVQIAAYLQPRPWNFRVLVLNITASAKAADDVIKNMNTAKIETSIFFIISNNLSNLNCYCNYSIKAMLGWATFCILEPINDKRYLY